MSLQLRKHIEEIVSLTDAEFDYVLSHFEPKKFRKHQFIVQAGNDVFLEYFVLNGLLKTTYPKEDGKDHIVQFSMENWWVTDYQAFFNQQKATFNIDCVEDVSLLMLTFSNKNKLCTEMHKMEHFFRIKTNGGYVALQQRILSFLQYDAKARYQQLIAKYPQLYQRVPKTLMASYLGVSRETLSRFSE